MKKLIAIASVGLFVFAITTFAFPLPWANIAGVAFGSLGGQPSPTAPEDVRVDDDKLSPAAIYTWNVAGNGLWNTATNWTPARNSPASDDVLAFNNGATITVTNIPAQTIGQLSIGGGTIVTLQTFAANTLTISGGAGALSLANGSELIISGPNALTINLPAGSTSNLDGFMSFADAGHRLTAGAASGITFRTGSIFVAAAGFSGNPFGTTSLNSVVFANGSTFIQSAGANPFGATQPNSVVVFQSGSLYSFQIPGAQSPVASGRTYANFEYNVAGGTGTSSGGSAVSMNNLTVTAGTYIFGMTGTPGHSIKGNISVEPGATLNFAPASAGTVNLNGAAQQTISGGGALTTGANSTLAITNSVGVVLQRGISTAGTVAVNTGGVLHCGTNVISGAGTFTLGAIGVLGIGDSVGITSAGATGNIQTTTRNFSIDGVYAFEGTTAQVTGNGVPVTVRSVNFDNPAGVTLSTSVFSSFSIVLSQGLVTTSGSAILGSTSTAVGAIVGGTATAYVKGPLYLTFPGGGASGRTFPVGKSMYNPVSVSGTASGLTAITAEVFDANSGGTPGVGMMSLNTDRYCVVSEQLGIGNLTPVIISITDPGAVAGKTIARSTSVNGTYANIGGTGGGGTLTSNAFATPSGFYVIGTPAPCPTITVNPTTVPSGTAGSAYSQTFTQTGGIGSITWSVAGTLPAGVTLNPTTGVLSGTPTQTGSFPITVTATDSNGCTGSRSYTLVIDCQTITVSPTTVPSGTAGSPYSQTFTQTGGIGTVTWSVTGTLPTGVTLNPATGILSGTPTQTGSFPITVTATDSNSCTGSRSYTLVIVVCTPPPSGMVAWYAAENNALDRQGPTFENGTLQNGLIFATGEVGQAFSFDGVDDYVEAPDSASFDATTELTIDAWFFPTEAKGHRVITKWGTSGFRSYNIDLNANGSISFYTSGDGNGFPSVTTPAGAVPINQWTHVAATYQGGTFQGIYINGVESASITGGGVPASLFNSTSTFRLGQNFNDAPGGTNYHGLLDEVEVFNRTLTAIEIQAIYNAGSAGKCDVCTAPPPGMVLWHAADGNPSDISGSANHGTPDAGVTYAAGKVGQAYSFNGPNSVVVPDSTSLDVTTEFTFDAWINPATLVPAGSAVISKVGGGAGNNGYQFGITPNNAEVFCQFNAAGEPWPFNQLIATVPGGIPASSWSHIACTYNNANITAYFNGSPIGTVAIGPKTVINSASTLRISGDDNQNPNVYFNGLIDEAEVFNRALSQTEIQAIYNAGSAGKCRPPTAAGATLSGRVMTAGGYGISNARVTVVGGPLTRPRTALTGGFGYYSFEELSAGQTYIVTVGSKRFTFAVPSRVISLAGDVTDADFVAEP